MTGVCVWTHDASLRAPTRSQQVLFQRCPFNLLTGWLSFYCKLASSSTRAVNNGLRLFSWVSVRQCNSLSRFFFWGFYVFIYPRLHIRGFPPLSSSQRRKLRGQRHPWPSAESLESVWNTLTRANRCTQLLGQLLYLRICSYQSQPTQKKEACANRRGVGSGLAKPQTNTLSSAFYFQWHQYVRSCCWTSERGGMTNPSKRSHAFSFVI